MKGFLVLLRVEEDSTLSLVLTPLTISLVLTPLTISLVLTPLTVSLVLTPLTVVLLDNTWLKTLSVLKRVSCTR